jgi:uncharacterized protein YcbX
MQLGTVKQIFRYPVKSMAGETLADVEFELRGMRGDRAWSIRDMVTGELAGAKKLPGLMGFASRYPDGVRGPAEIELPGGNRVGVDAPECAAHVSKALGHEVSIEALQPAEDLEFYKNKGSLPADVEGYLRGLFARTEDEPLPDLSKFPPEIFQYSSPPGTFFDAYPVLLMTEAGLAHVQSQSPDSRFDVRRFRPNLLIEGTAGDSPVPEFDWCGKQLQIGSVRMKITIECPRCVMTTVGFDDLPKDPTVMRTLVKAAGGNLGVYATIETAGRVSVGDAVVVGDESGSEPPS